MNKAFTLAELMGVIVVLGVIAVIATTAIDRSLRTSRYETCMAQEKNIIEGAKAWSIDNADKLPASRGASTPPVSLSTLSSGGYIEDLTSPMTNKTYSSGTAVQITWPSDGNYDYEVIYGQDKEYCCYKNEAISACKGE